MITREMIARAYGLGMIELVPDESSYDILCRIGALTFYFGVGVTEGLTVEDYKRAVPQYDIVSDIYGVLDGFMSTRLSAYQYCEDYLRKHLSSEQMVAYDTESVLTLNMAHLTMETFNALAEDKTILPSWSNTHGYGVIVRLLDAADDPDVPDDLRPCLELADDLNCGYIRFDCDGQIVESLPIHDWQHNGR